MARAEDPFPERQSWRTGANARMGSSALACGSAEDDGQLGCAAEPPHARHRSISRSTKAAHRSSSAVSIHSSALCACSIEPGPMMTVGIPAPSKSPASVPKATLAWSFRPASDLASVTIAASGEASRPGKPA